MKILHLLDTTNRGGAETQVLDVCRRAADFGFEITMVACGGGALESEFAATGVEFIRLQRKLPLDIYLSSQIRKIIREREIEIVHGYQAVEGLHLYLAAHRLPKVKKVLSFQGFIPGRKNRLTAKFVAPLMDANITVSKSLLQYLREETKIKKFDNFQLIYNGADRTRLEPTGKSLRAELNLPPDVLLGGMIGNFLPDPTKDQLTICRALPRVMAEISNFQFVFAGKIADGAEEKAADCINFCIENKIIERVHFLGMRSDVPDILAALDLFVFSSLREGLPVAVCEAMLAGVPLIASDIAPLMEISDGGKCAEIFPTGDAEILSEKILHLLKDKNSRDELAEKAATFAGENFSIESHLTNLKMLYQNLIEKTSTD